MILRAISIYTTLSTDVCKTNKLFVSLFPQINTVGGFSIFNYNNVAESRL